ncbi:MAG TPA: phospho-sugar mutase, partial [Myxococcales bacterium]|nr:phospho-sugar mutase [Myxococcales bacterium]
TPADVAGVPIVRSRDLIDGADGLAPHNCLSWWLEDETRIMLRPSGTEPKLKLYIQVVEEWNDQAEARAQARMDRLSEEIFERLF